MREPLIVSRKLGIIEQYLASRTLNDFYNNFTVIGRYDRVLTKEIIFVTMKRLMFKYSLLTCNYVSAENKICPIERICLGDILEIVKKPIPIDYDELLLEIDKYKFEHDCQKPFFKLLLINNTTLAVIFEHTIFDGGSGFNFHKLFIQEINKLKPDDIPQKVDLDDVLFNSSSDLKILEPLAKAADDYLTFEPDAQFVFKRYLKSVLPNSLSQWINDHNYATIPSNNEGKSLKKWKGIVASREFETYYKLMNFTSVQTKNILELCRSKKVTITSFLEIFSLRLLVKFGAIRNPNDEEFYVNSMIPINLRRFLSEDDKQKCELGIFVNPNINNLEITKLEKCITDEELFWSLCQNSCSIIKKNSTDSRVLMKFYSDFISSYDSNTPEKMKEKLLKNFELSDGVNTRLSNLGVFMNEKTDAVYNLDDIVFNQSIGVNGGSIVFNVISTNVNGMNIVFSCLHGILRTREEVELYCSEFKEEILELLEKNSFVK